MKIYIYKICPINSNRPIYIGLTKNFDQRMTMHKTSEFLVKHWNKCSVSIISQKRKLRPAKKLEKILIATHKKRGNCPLNQMPSHTQLWKRAPRIKYKMIPMANPTYEVAKKKRYTKALNLLSK